MSKRNPWLTAAFVAVALVVTLSFLGRRSGMLPGPLGGPGSDRTFDVEDYVDLAPISPAEASGHVGERAVVCGRVASATHAPSIGGEPTWLNFGAPHPEQDFDVVVWGRDRGAFSTPPEIAYAHRDVCVAGRIIEHQGIPRIEVREPAQFQVRGPDSGRSQIRRPPAQLVHASPTPVL
jgi:hypothetical protein